MSRWGMFSEEGDQRIQEWFDGFVNDYTDKKMLVDQINTTKFWIGKFVGIAYEPGCEEAGDSVVRNTVYCALESHLSDTLGRTLFQRVWDETY